MSVVLLWSGLRVVDVTAPSVVVVFTIPPSLLTITNEPSDVVATVLPSLAVAAAALLVEPPGTFVVALPSLFTCNSIELPPAATFTVVFPEELTVVVLPSTWGVVMLPSSFTVPSAAV
jgi:hypothetical protein